jgi:hypothetical protein
MKTFNYRPIETYIIEVEENEKRYLFLYFIHSKQGQILWHLTSQIQRVLVTNQKAFITTKNSKYMLYTEHISYEKLSITEFLHCKKGHTPLEAKMLVNLNIYNGTTRHKGVGDE